MICMFSFSSLRINREVVQKRKLNKNTKQKSKNKDNDVDVQSTADSDENDDSEYGIGKAPPKNKSILCISQKMDTTYRTFPVGSRRVLRC